MNISEIFIRRPIATSLLMAAVAIFGLLSYTSLSVSDLPLVEKPTVSVSAALPGGDPASMASTVASPLERQFTTIAGVDEMTSSSTSGSSNITLQFDLDRNIDSAITDVQTAIAAATPLLPTTLSAPPSYRKQNPADQELLVLNLTSNTLPITEVDDYANNLIGQRLSMIDGVAKVDDIGGQKYAVRVQIDPNKLVTRNIGLNEVDLALQNWNANQPTGQLFGGSTYTVVVNGQLTSPRGLLHSAEAFGPLLLSYQQGRPVRLSDVATVRDSRETMTSDSWLYTKSGRERTVALSVWKQPGLNVIEVTDRVLAVLPSLIAQLPPALHLGIRQDLSVPIRQSFHDISITLLITLGLVVLVIFVFLGNISATLIPALAMPFAILGTFAVMKLNNYSLDNLSMMALILSTGFVVDDAIVMLENIVRHMEAGADALQASLVGAKEISFTILTMTTSLAAVFIPILFMAGILGRLFREFAVTITTAILISGVVSVTLTPMLCSRFLSFTHGKRGFSGLMDRAFASLRQGYARSLRVVLRYRLVTLASFFVVLGTTLYMFGVVPKGFIPEIDNDTLNIQLRANQGTSFYDMVKYVEQVGGTIIKNPNIDAMVVSTGSSTAGGMNTGGFKVSLKRRAERALSASQVAQQLRGALGRYPGFQAFVNVPQALQIGGFQSNSNYNLMVQSLNFDELSKWAPVLAQEVTVLPEVQEVSTNLEARLPRVDLVIDRDTAAKVGLDATQIATTLNDGLGPKWSSTLYGPRAQYKVLLELDPKYQEHADSLKRLDFKTKAGVLVPLESVVKFKNTVGPNSVNHMGELPAVSVSFSLRPGVSLGTAVDHINEIARRVLPGDVTTAFQGTAQVFQQSLSNLPVLLIVAIGVVYIVLGILYESYIHPLTILSGLPSAGLGALVTLWLFHTELNIYSFVGLIMLIGIVKKNAIMQIDFALEQERQHGKTPEEAIYEGCVIRFRPIMMTTAAALFGALPLALGFGAGGDSRRPLGLAVVGGLVVSQAITLYLTPVIYLYMSKLLKTRQIVGLTPKPATA